MTRKEKLLVAWILVVVAIGFLFHNFLSWTVYAFQNLRVSKGGCVQLDSAAGAGEICGGGLVLQSIAVSQKTGPPQKAAPTGACG